MVVIRSIMFHYVCVFVCIVVSSAHVLDLQDNKITEEITNKRVCIIGAGIAGLSTARYMKEEGIDFTVLEATRYIGGTWRYDPRVGTDENGQPLYTSMYDNLRTNLPKPTMELGGFPLPDGIPSFPSRKIYYKYLEDYAKHFDLERYIKFLHNVVLVTRENNKWRVKHQHVKTFEEFEEYYDYVVVGNGHFSKPYMPNIPGEDKFKGTIIHSHDFRVKEPYRNKRVLIVGAGPSGMDIGLDVATISQKLIHSHHARVTFNTPFPPNYIRKPDAKELTENGAWFVDGSFEEFDDIIYCTGFQYNFPFFDETSGVTVTSSTVTPLYKYMVNINQPTMVIMGLVNRACIVVALDAQARYATALVKGNFTLPSREEMMQDWQRRADAVLSKGLPLSALHALAEREDQYYADLTAESGIGRVPPVYFKIRAVDTQAKLDNLYTYRNYVYTVIDNNTFSRSLENQPVRESLSP